VREMVRSRPRAEEALCQPSTVNHNVGGNSFARPGSTAAKANSPGEMLRFHVVVICPCAECERKSARSYETNDESREGGARMVMSRECREGAG
jgi:hypothetical protein